MPVDWRSQIRQSWTKFIRSQSPVQPGFFMGKAMGHEVVVTQITDRAPPVWEPEGFKHLSHT